MGRTMVLYNRLVVLVSMFFLILASVVFVFVSTPTTFQSREIVLTRIKGEKLTKIR